MTGMRRPSISITRNIRRLRTSPFVGARTAGLLIGASMTQRPDLWGAIWCGYPLLDMLRYQKFLMGRT